MFGPMGGGEGFALSGDGVVEMIDDAGASAAKAKASFGKSQRATASRFGGSRNWRQARTAVLQSVGVRRPVRRPIL